MRRVIWAYWVLLFVYFAPLITAQPVTCDATDGRGIVACVARTYPEKLAAGVSAETRAANTAFLRDRIIETARCAKLDVSRNCKRGNCKNLSLDFVAWKVDGLVEGVDIASAYDDTSKPLKLQWHTYGPPDYGFPTYTPYGPVSCVTPEPEPEPSDLEQRVSALEAQIAGMAAQLIAEIRFLEQQLRQALDGEAMDRINGDIALREDVTRIDAKPIPQTCRARIFGITVGCTLE